jgi:DNA-binding beta-propeller fold protein YncE
VATPDGHYAYAADYNASVKAYTVDLVTGIMTVQGGVYTAQTGFSTRGSVVSPNGRYLYVLNRGGDVTQFNIAVNGSLSPANGIVFSTGLNETFEHIVMDPDGKFLYLTNTVPPPHNFVLGWTVNGTTGALTRMPANFLAGVNEQGMAFIKVP